jgi:hypothetical protein
MKRTIAIDLETLSLAPNAVVIAIGAICIETGETFYANIDPEDSQRYGLHIDAGTVMWWMQQSDEARNVLTTETSQTLATVLLGFTHWLKTNKFKYANREHTLWGYGATADIVWMNSLYKVTQMQQPWTYQQEMCGRTLKQITGVNPDKSGVHHNALDDAKWLADVIVQSKEKR